MVQFVLIHPGSTDYRQQKLVQGRLDVPLNAEGNNEVAQLIERLRPLGLEAVYTSEGQPAAQTAETIAEAFELKCRKLDRFENLNLGLWQGMAVEEIRRKQPKVYRQWQESPECVCPPEGEMLADADERVRSALARLVKRHKDGTIGVVASEPLASLVRRYFTHGPLGDLWKAALQAGGFEVFSTEPAGVSSP
ncbi:MAG: histidine phosphatase family protein [Pirellulales bacterium]|jgi:probable phosphoglycerate mutase|nr:histidine phosphatase family protein [Thermoguttaceae bacterium]MDD4786287.1 histidine phosphatase family protein [Pirellulales bacterium]